MVIQIIKNTILKVTANADPGLNQTVKEFHWYLDKIELYNTSYDLALDTIPMEIGLHILVFEALNMCGNKSSAELQFELIEVNRMEKEITVVVDQPTVQAVIVMDFTGSVQVTVTDQFNKPVEGATLDLNGTPTGISTGADGKALIPNVPYGTHKVKAIKL